LKNPLSDSKDTLFVVAMGDSVVWGNGLYDPHTFMYTFGQDLANLTGRNVQVVFYAHSGARLYRVDDYTSTLYLNPDGSYIGDVSSQRPTTEEQASCAARPNSDGGYPQAEILVMDGCINDVGATEIALPFPLNFTNSGEIVEDASACGARWPDFLQNQVLNNFPKATVIVLNYYQVVSDLSKPLDAAAVRAGAATVPSPDETALGDAVGKLHEKRLSLIMKSGLTAKRAEARIGQGTETSTVGTAAEKSRLKISQWSANSTAFLVTTQCYAVKAVNAADGLPNPFSCPTTGTYDPSNPPNPPPIPTPAQATQSSRTYLAAPDPYPWPPDYSYGAANTHLWYLPIPKDRQYEDYDDQLKRCRAQFSLISFTDYDTCIWDPMGHPNVYGAESYHKSLVAVMNEAWKVN